MNFNSLANSYLKALRRLLSGRVVGITPDPNVASDPQFQRMAYRVAYRMAKMAAAQNVKGWRQAAMKSTKAKEIYKALQEEIRRTGLRAELQKIAVRNATLIRSIPQQISRHIAEKAVQLQQEGKRDKEIISELKRIAPRLTRSKMKCIARTEISRAETDLTKLRSERIGIEWYQWETSNDRRVRDSHRKMDKVLVPWNSPPSPEALVGTKSTLGKYHAGSCPNCRCLALPLASLDEVQFPAKVFRNGSVTRMTRHQFAQIAGIA